MSLTGPEIVHAIGLQPQEAVRFLRSKAPQVTGAWSEWLDGQHARAFTVANVAKLDVLQEIQTSLAKALADGQSVQQWRDGLVPELRRRGWWRREGTVQELQAAGRVDAEGVIAKGLTPQRLKTIFQTNMQTAYQAGRYEQMLEQAEDRPYWQYVAILDGRTRPAHRAMNGRIFRYDDPGWKSFYPPCGYNCRCRVRNFSQTDVTRRKLDVSSTDGKLGNVEVPLKDGQVATVTRYRDPSLPGGKFQPDPGFSNNPALDAFQPRLEPMDTALSRRYVETALQGPAFERFVQGTDKGVFPVAVLKDAQRAQLGTTASVAYLSDETLAKQREQHADIGLADYRLIPAIVDDGDAYEQGNQRLLFLADAANPAQLYRLALKTTKGRDELYVLSLFRTTREKAQKEVVNQYKRVR